MQKPFLALALLVSLGSAPPVRATEPGTPMDCSDLELAPGLTCTTLLGSPRGGFGNFATRAVVDNEGRIIVEGGDFETIGTCGGQPLLRVVLLHTLSITDGTRSPLVTGRWRCLDDPTGRREFISSFELLFDLVRGSLLVTGSSSCSDRFSRPCPDYGGGPWILRIDGFTPLADALPPAPPPAPLCSNGLDDDGDGRVDAADAHCKSDADNDESRP